MGNNFGYDVTTKSNVLLTDLPLEVIVHILDFLSLVDKYRASMTCRIMYEAFNQPSLWRTYELTILPTMFCSRHHEESFNVPNKTRLLVEKFGKYIQFLTISVIGHITGLTKWHSVLLELGKQCRLEKLVLEVGKMTTVLDLDRKPPPEQDLIILLSFIDNAFRMKSLDIKSWPIFSQTMLNENQNIFKALIKNSKLKDLEHLDLFWPYQSRMWSERRPVLPNCHVILDIVKHLAKLKELGIRSTMLSNELIEELADPRRSSKLSLLKILVSSATDDDEFETTRRSSVLWKQLRKVNPNVGVEYHLMTRMTNSQLSDTLPVDCPVSKVVFLKWARMDSQLIESLIMKYSSTLQSLQIYCDATEIDNALLKMVEECKLLNSLLISATSMHSIHYRTILKLASHTRCTWETFRFDEKNISFLDKLNTVRDDNVLSRNEEGEYSLVGIKSYTREPQGQDREKCCEALKETLATILGLAFVVRNQTIATNR